MSFDPEQVAVGVAKAFEAAAVVEAIRRKLLISPAEAAKITPCSEGALEKLRKRGRGPAYSKVGSKVFYRPEDILAWAEKRKVRMREAA